MLLGEELHEDFLASQACGVDRTVGISINWTLGPLRTPNFVGLGGLGGSAAWWSFRHDHAVGYVTKRLHDHALSERDAHTLGAMLDSWITPTEVQPFLGWLRGAQTAFKNFVYPMWPAAHFRNAVSALYNNFLHGTGLEDYLDAARILRGGGIADVTRYAATHGMTPEQAADKRIEKRTTRPV